MITVNRESLLNKLNILEKAYNQKNSISALTFLKFSNGKMTMSDGNVTIITRVDILQENKEEDFKALIPFKLFKEILAKLNDKDIDLYLKGSAIEIKTNKSKYTLNTTDFNSYPNISINKLENVLEISPKELKKIIKKTSISCATNEKRPVLTGVNLKMNNNELKVYATDSFRLSHYKTNVNNNKNDNEIVDYNLTIKCSDMNNLLKIIEDDSNLEIRYDNNHIIFSFDDVLYQTRLLEGTYPDCQRIIPPHFNYNCKINREKFKNAIDRINVFSKAIDSTYGVIILNIKNNNMEITSIDSQLGNAKENLDCQSSDEIKIACSSQNIMEALNTFDDEEINIGLNEGLKPFVITSESDSNLIQLLLPVKINE